MAITRWHAVVKLTWTAIAAIEVAAGSELASMARLLLLFPWQ